MGDQIKRLPPILGNQRTFPTRLRSGVVTPKIMVLRWLFRHSRVVIPRFPSVLRRTNTSQCIIIKSKLYFTKNTILVFLISKCKSPQWLQKLRSEGAHVGSISRRCFEKWACTLRNRESGGNGAQRSRFDYISFLVI